MYVGALLRGTWEIVVCTAQQVEHGSLNTKYFWVPILILSEQLIRHIKV